MRVSGTLVLGLLAAAARAGDAPTPTPAPDAIAAARSDLEEIKVPAAPQDLATLPTVDMKDIGPVPGSIRPEESLLITQGRDPSLDPNKRKPGTGNWLVDAMDRNTAAQASRSKEKDDVLKGDPDLVRTDDRGVRLEKDLLLPDDPREKEQAEPTATVYNPLDAFMNGWVSARDRDLLLTSSKGDGVAVGDVGKVHADPNEGIDLGQWEPAKGDAIGGVDAAALNSAGGTNPYIESLETLPSPAFRTMLTPDSAFVPSEVQDLPRGMSSGLDPGPGDGSRGVIPDFAQPTDDDKYFKQLKKF